jgi:hypothetical protein
MAIIPGSAKVLNQYENVNTTYGGSKAMKAQSKWYTMDDVIETINANQPYKVFTALVSQTGDTNPNNLSAGPVQEGVTYRLSGVSSASDFSNVGGPGTGEAIDDTYFIATSTATPNDYGGGLLIYDSAAPVAIILENTIGNIWIEYSSSGVYSIKSNDLFTLDKTFINGTSLANYSVFNQLVTVVSGEDPGFRGYFFNQDNSEEIILNTLKNSTQFDYDIITNPTCIEIRVYN